MLIVSITIVILSFAPTAKGAPPLPLPTHYPMGSPEAVTNYCVSKVIYLEAILYKIVGPNNSIWIDERYLNRTFSSKEELDSLARSWAQEMVAQYVATGGDQTGQFKVSVFGESVNPFATVLFVPYLFTFPQAREAEVGAAAVSLPNFSTMSTKLPPSIPYHAPGVTRAILQIKGDEFMGVIDSKGSPNVIKLDSGIMHIETRYLVDRPGWTNELTVITSNPKTFRVHNHQGVWVNERIPYLRLDKTSSTLKLSVENCAAGRIYRVEESTDLVQWTPTPLIFEGPYEYLGAKTNFIITPTTPGKSYRVVGDTSLLP